MECDFHLTMLHEVLVVENNTQILIGNMVTFQLTTWVIKVLHSDQVEDI